jgi:hypothetical protein
MWEWILIAAVYALILLFFRFLGGFGAAGEAFELWGRNRAAAWANRASSTSG